MSPTRAWNLAVALNRPRRLHPLAQHSRLAFFSSMSSLPAKPPVHLILDWDGTVTKKDTLLFLGKICTAHSESKQQSAPAASWAEIVQAYADDYNAHAESYIPEKSHRKSILDESKWLASLHDVENRSVKRVEDAGIFKGLTASDIREGAMQALVSGQLQLRDGWSELFNSADQVRSSKVSILSVNWSTRFIRECLLQAASKLRLDDPANIESLQRTLSDLNIDANEIEGLDDPGGSSGLLNKNNERGIRTSADKLARITSVLRRKVNAIIIYVGDSTTDFDALLAADVGICIRDNPMSSGQRELAEALERVGVDVQPLEELDQRSRAAEDITRVWWAENLKKITEYINGSKPAQTWTPFPGLSKR